MSATTPAGSTPYYFIPSPSRHPVLVAFGLFLVILGAGQWVNGAGWGAYSLLIGMIMWLTVLFQWFSQAVGESEAHQYSDRVDLSYRWSMSWFIFSEVMFFAAFFGAPASPRRPRAPSSPSPPSAPGRCPPSPPRCCSPRA